MHEKHSTVTVHRNGEYWQARWVQDGKRKAKGLGSRAKVSEAEAWAAALKLQSEMRREVADRADAAVPSWGELCVRWTILNEDLKATSMELYQRTWRRMAGVIGRDHPVDAIGEHEIREFEAAIAHLQLITRRRELRHLKTIFRFAQERGWILALPTAGRATSVPPIERTQAYVTLGDFARMVEGATSDEHRLVLALCRLAGLRLGEALRLRWADIDWSAKMLTVHAEAGRRTTKQRRREVPIEDWLLELLKAAYDRAESLPERISGGMTKDEATGRTRLLLERLKLSYPKPHHSLRGSLVTDWHGRDYPTMDVCAWLGHSPQVAAKHYHDAKQAMWRVNGTAPPKKTSGPLRP